MKFPLRESTVEFRGQAFRVREISQRERTHIAQEVTKDRFMGPALFASIGCMEPTMSVDEAADAPAELVEFLARTVMNLSGLGEKGEKEDDAGKA